MLALLRLLFVLLILQTIVYVALSLYSRAQRRNKLEAEWDEEIRKGDRDAFIEQGLQEYDGSLRRKLILAVYIVPLTTIAVLVYVGNYM